jgi:hypothetical protein
VDFLGCALCPNSGYGKEAAGIYLALPTVWLNLLHGSIKVGDSADDE